MAKTSRNAPCPCGSGKKHKHCCLGKAAPEARRKRVLLPLLLLLITVGISVLLGLQSGYKVGLSVAGAGVIVVGIIASFYNPPPSQGGKGDSSSIDFGR